jgi:uncharacterized protein
MRGRPHLFGLLAGMFLAAGLVGAAMVLTRAWLRIAEFEVVNVTGSARKGVRSDLVIWRGSFSTEAETLVEARRRLKADAQKVVAFLQGSGATNASVSAIGIQEMRARVRGEAETTEQRTVGYRLSQNVEVQTGDHGLAEKLTSDSAGLVEQGVAFVTQDAQFIYTKAGDTKVEMLAEATRDARARAEQIAAQGGRAVNQLRSARMGVFQITPEYSTQTSWEGMSDTTARDKTITAVVTASFSLR